jgi:hypothetical protein
MVDEDTSEVEDAEVGEFMDISSVPTRERIENCLHQLRSLKNKGEPRTRSRSDIVAQLSRLAQLFFIVISITLAQLFS